MHGCRWRRSTRPIGVVASIAAWTARETQHSDARLRVNRRPTLTPPDSALSDWNNDEIGESRRIRSVSDRDRSFL
jgi:hypothetical protein